MRDISLATVAHTESKALHEVARGLDQVAAVPGHVAEETNGTDLVPAIANLLGDAKRVFGVPAGCLELALSVAVKAKIDEGDGDRGAISQAEEAGQRLLVQPASAIELFSHHGEIRQDQPGPANCWPVFERLPEQYGLLSVDFGWFDNPLRLLDEADPCQTPGSAG